MTLAQDPDGNTWTSEVRAAARRAVVHATSAHRTAHAQADRTLGYFLRRALAHGLTVDEVCAAGQLDPETVARLTDPAVA